MTHPPTDTESHEAGAPNFRRALGWSYLMHGGQYAVTTVVTLILAAVLGPEAFGVVAMALVYIMFLTMVLRQGMVPAIVQRPDLSKEQLNGVFWLIVVSGVVLSAISYSLAGMWATLNRTPELESVIRVLTLLIPIQSLIIVQDAVLRRKMDFRSLAMRTNTAALVGGAAGLAMAFGGYGVWALVAQQLVTAFVELVVLWSLSEWRPQMRFSLKGAGALLGFSSHASLAAFGTFVSNRADALLIGLFFGPAAVGIYRLASRFVDIVIDVTVRSLQAVALPELALLQTKRAEFADRTTKIINASAVLALPMLGVLAGAADALVALLGDEWSAAAGPLKLLCVVGAIRALTMFLGPALSALGRPGLLAFITWVSALVSAGSFVLAGALLADSQLIRQVTGIAATRLVMFGTVGLLLSIWATVRSTEMRISDMGRAALGSVAAGVVGFVVAQTVSVWLDGSGVILRLVVVVAAGALVAGLIIFWREPVVRESIHRFVPRLKSAS